MFYSGPQAGVLFIATGRGRERAREAAGGEREAAGRREQGAGRERAERSWESAGERGAGRGRGGGGPAPGRPERSPAAAAAAAASHAPAGSGRALSAREEDRWARGPVAGGRGAALWEHGGRRAGTRARDGARRGLVGVGRSAGKADSRFAFSRLRTPFGSALPGAANVGLRSSGWEPEQPRTRAGRLKSEPRPRPACGARESGVCRRIEGTAELEPGQPGFQGPRRGPQPREEAR